MEEADRKLIEELSSSHRDLKNLWQKHLTFEAQLQKLEKKNFLTPEEEIQVKQLKLQKLDGKTKLVQLLKQYTS